MRFFSFLIFLLLLVSCTPTKKEVLEINKNRILFVVSNQHTYGYTDINTANHFGEIVFAYDVFVKNNYEVDFVSPKGGAIPIGYLSTSDSIHKKYIYDSILMSKLKKTKSANEIIAKNYKAIYLNFISINIKICSFQF